MCAKIGTHFLSYLIFLQGTLIEVRIKTFLFEEFEMGSSLYNSSFIQYKDLIALLNRIQPVGNNQAGPPFHQTIQRLLNLNFRNGVDTARSLVQY